MEFGIEAERTVSLGNAAPPSAPAHRRAAQPWLSVLMPSYRGEKWLAATLDSLVAQTRGGFELILIDGSDDDATIDIAARYQHLLDLRIERRPDLTDWQSKTNAAARLATADHVCMLHTDDLWEPRRAETIFQWIAAQPEITMHLHPTWIVDRRGRRLGLWRCPLPTIGIAPRELLLERLLVQNFISICAPVVRKSAFIEVGGFDTTLWYTADWDFYLKLGRMGSVRYHAEPLTGYRIHGGALTVSGSRDAAAFAQQMTSVLDRHIAAVAPRRRKTVLRRARAAVSINVALARAFHTSPDQLLTAISRVAALGPFGWFAFARDTRLAERLLPRLRGLLADRARVAAAGDGFVSPSPNVDLPLAS